MGTNYLDVLSREQRRRAMQAVKSKDTSIERKLRHLLWSKGYRYRKNYSGLAGKPDITFTHLKIAVFLDSEFWHGFDWERNKYKIKTNRKFWWRKIERNIARDSEVTSKLQAEGWKVVRIWASDLERNPDNCVRRIEREIALAVEGGAFHAE